MPEAEPAALFGIVVPLLTPTDAGDRVIEDALRRSIDRLIGAGVHGLFIGGSAGEGPLLADREWERLVEIAFDANRGRVALLAGAQETSTRRVVDRARRLVRVGYRHVVVTPTYYVRSTTPGEHLRLFSSCREAGDGIDVIPYNIPQVTGSVIAVETFVKLARDGAVRTCKESSGDAEYLTRLVNEGGAFGLRVLAGEERNASSALRTGAVGLVPVCANIEPKPYLDLFNTARVHDDAAVERLQGRIRGLVESIVLSGPCWLSGPKYALGRLGFGPGTPVAPLPPAGAEQAARIEEWMRTDAR